MTVSTRHVLEHGPMLRALGSAALSALRGARAHRTPEVPGPWIEGRAAAPSRALVDDFVRATGGDPGSYRGVLPPQLFPQWTLATASRALGGLPYPIAKVVNAGCRLEIRGPVPAGEPLVVRARLAAVDETESRVVLSTRIETGVAAAPDALVAELRAYVPLGGARKPGPPSGPPLVIPAGARELARPRLAATAGLDFAKLTGDFNPIHWIAPYARAAGFRSCILHGFGTFALAASAIVRTQLAGDAGRLELLDVRFTRPLVLPATVGVYVTAAGDASLPSDARRHVFVGDAPNSAPYLAGTYQIGDAP
ncbi:MAG: MaoC family dehydratase N-terminal domain-containing protein [Myxococcales bacterium]|nr:MaoC family dehydratase N-terminal domain-containing protein [Myxococcales bacterium]